MNTCRAVILVLAVEQNTTLHVGSTSSTRRLAIGDRALLLEAIRMGGVELLDQKYGIRSISAEN